jgi:hypothetical protein
VRLQRRHLKFYKFISSHYQVHIWIGGWKLTEIVALEVSFQNSSCAKFNKQLHRHDDGKKWGCIHKFDVLNLELLRPVNNHRKLDFYESYHIHREGADCLLSHPNPKHTKKNDDMFFFVYVGTHNNLFYPAMNSNVAMLFLFILCK